MKKTNHKTQKALFMVLFTIITLALALNVSCGDGGGGGGGGGFVPDPTPTQTVVDTGVITGTVINEGGFPEKDIEVSWGVHSRNTAAVRDAGHVDYTDSNGNFTLYNIPVGYQTVTAVKSGELARSVEVYVDYNSIVSTGNIQIDYVGHLNGNVYDSNTSSPLVNATVEVRISGWGNLTVSIATDTNGYYSLPYLQTGIHPISAYKSGYNYSEGTITIVQGETSFADFLLTPSSTPTPTPSPTGTVTPTPMPSPTGTVTPTPTPTSGDFVTDGKKWFSHNIPVNYYINPIDAGVPATDFIGAILAGKQKWNDVTGINFAFNYRGETTRRAVLGDGFNVWCWNTTGEGLGGGTLALTTFQHYVNTKEIIECDVEYNGTYTWVWEANPSNAYDLQSVATHEAGHWLYLDHPDNINQIMYFRYTGQRELGSGDIAGIRYLYGSGLSEILPIVTGW